MLSDFVRLMGIGVILATPAIFITYSALLQNFPIQAKLGPGFLGAQLAIMILLGLVVTSFQTLRVAFSNPVSVIRSE